MKTTATKKTDTNSFAPYINIGDVFVRDQMFYQVVKITPTGRVTLWDIRKHETMETECTGTAVPLLADWRDPTSPMGKVTGIIQMEVRHQGDEPMVYIKPRREFSLKKWDGKPIAIFPV